MTVKELLLSKEERRIPLPSRSHAQAVKRNGTGAGNFRSASSLQCYSTAISSFNSQLQSFRLSQALSLPADVSFCHLARRLRLSRSFLRMIRINSKNNKKSHHRLHSDYRLKRNKARHLCTGDINILISISSLWDMYRDIGACKAQIHASRYHRYAEAHGYIIILMSNINFFRPGLTIRYT